MDVPVAAVVVPAPLQHNPRVSSTKNIDYSSMMVKGGGMLNDVNSILLYLRNNPVEVAAGWSGGALCGKS